MSETTRRTVITSRPSVKLPEQKPAQQKQKNSYFTQTEKGGIKFIHSGCVLLDCVLGGGWPIGRVSNIVGDKSSGKQE